MEQELVDSSKYQISIHSLDSRFSDLKNNVNSEFRIQNPVALKNIIRVRLASVEVPLVEPMFSTMKGNDSFRIKIGAAPKFINTGILMAGNYTAASLCVAVQALLFPINSQFTCSLNPINGLVTISNPTIPFTIDFSSTNTEISNRPTHWGLGYYLGFRESLVSSVTTSLSGESMTGTSVINVQPNAYYLLQLKCPDSVVNVTHRVNAGSHVDAFAKIVLTDNYYQLQFDNNSNLLRKEYTFLSPINVPFFQVSLLDPWGQLVNMLDADWSLTMEVTEVVNYKTYKSLLNTYSR